VALAREEGIYRTARILHLDYANPRRGAEAVPTDVERAQQHYRDTLGFEIGWLYPGKEIGAVSRGEVAIFFRKRKPPFEPAVHWVFGGDIDASYQELKSLGANIAGPLEKKPWDCGNFTVKDLDGNLLLFPP
jgi:hypothetical protein